MCTMVFCGCVCLCVLSPNIKEKFNPKLSWMTARFLMTSSDQLMAAA